MHVQSMNFFAKCLSSYFYLNGEYPDSVKFSRGRQSMTFKLFIFALSLSVAACSSYAGHNPHVANDSETADCVAGGGEMLPSGMRQRPLCVTPYSDGGKTCTDSTDCEGLCTTDDDRWPRGADIKGPVCEFTDSPFGCRSEVENGVADFALCID